LRALDLPLTIVRPVYFFENFGGWGLQPREGGEGYTLAMPLSPGTTLQSVAVDDIGARVDYFQLPWEALKEQNEDLYLMNQFLEREGYQADIAALRAEYPGLHTFEQWLAEGGLAHLRKAA
jgi:uncharacterized protein YbjT (DUF2867 family)